MKFSNWAFYNSFYTICTRENTATDNLFAFFFFWRLFVLCLFAYVMHVYMFSHVRFFVTPMDCKPARLICPCESPGKNTGVHCHFLLQGIFLAQGSNPCLLWFLH